MTGPRIAAHARGWTFFVAAASALTAPLAGCRHDVEERLGIDERKGTPQFDPTSLDNDNEVERALRTSSAEVARRLGAYRLVQESHVTVSVGERKESFVETWKLEVDAKGNAHTLHDNDRGYGTETYAVGNTFYVRPRYSQMVKRVPEGDEVERARDEVQGVMGSYLSVLGRFATRDDGGGTTVAGRKAHKVKLGLESSPSRLRDTDPTHAWRKSIKATALSGELVLDDETGAPLHAVLSAEYTARRARAVSADAKPVEEEVHVTVALKADTEAVGAVPPVTAPPDAIAAPLRPRPLLERQQLLDGLVTLPSKAPPKPERDR